MSTMSQSMAALQRDAEAYAASLSQEHQRLIAERHRLETDTMAFEAKKTRMKAMFAHEEQVQKDVELDNIQHFATAKEMPTSPSVQARGFNFQESKAVVERATTAVDARIRGFQLEREALRTLAPPATVVQPRSPTSLFSPLPPEFLRPLLTQQTTADPLLPVSDDALTGFVLNIGPHLYTVLPMCPVDETRIKNDMRGKTVVVPDGWEVLSTSMQDFNEIMYELCQRSWGTPRLCVEDQSTFTSFATALKIFGSVGERLNANTNVFSQDKADPRKFIFNELKNVSGRLVIRASAPGSPQRNR